MTEMIQEQGRFPIGKLDYNLSPYLVLWELTRACTLACKHCRAKAIRQRNPYELSMDECRRLLDQLMEFGRPLIVLTGGDPVQRPDLFEIIQEARARNFKVAITPSATPVTTRNVVKKLKEAGIERLAISIDGPDAETHDGFRRVKGSFEISMNIVRWAHEFGLPVQINTTISRHNFAMFDRMSELAAELKATLWSIFFLVPTGRASVDMQISPLECEEILQKMAMLAATAPYDIKSTAGPAFRRVILDFVANNSADIASGEMKLNPTLRLGALRSYQSVNDGKGILFVSDTGDIYPSGFLPIAAGNVKTDSIVEVYRNHTLFKSLRAPALLQGKCGECRYKVVCGGSRARAYGATGDYLAEDPICAYREPQRAG